jgi:hypothetical protein
VVYRLYDTELFEKVANTNNTDITNSVHPTAQAEHTFRTIGNDSKGTITIIKIGEVLLKRYLSARYHSRLAIKMCALFDWNTPKINFL